MSEIDSKAAETIAFQGAPGAYSDMSCREVFPDMHTLPCKTFTDAFAAVSDGAARLAMIPIENSVAGRVADIHQLLPESDLHIIAEHYQPVHHQLLACKGATAGELKIVRSHVHALSQCRNVIKRLGLNAIVHADTAGAAAEIAKLGDPTIAAIASELAADIYGLKLVEAGVEDEAHNTTRFVVLANKAIDPDPADGPVVTSFVFHVRNVPAALYKALGGFSTNGVNMTKLESYMVGGKFTATQFFAEVEAHPSERRLQLALEELAFFTSEVNIMGVYPAHPFRVKSAAKSDNNI
jgi:prephenate dehydratase